MAKLKAFLLTHNELAELLRGWCATHGISLPADAVVVGAAANPLRQGVEIILASESFQDRPQGWEIERTSVGDEQNAARLSRLG